MAEPFCKELRTLLVKSARELKLRHHTKGTVITIEGPRFSTKAESHMFRSFGADVINMSTVPEVILAREIGICYQTIAMSTDYDCWKEGEEPVTWEMILSIMNKNSENVKKLLLKTIGMIKYEHYETCNPVRNTGLISNGTNHRKRKMMPIKSKIRTVPDYPKKGIMFRDITTLIKDPVGFRLVIDSLTQRYITGDVKFDVIVGIESRGFIIGGALSLHSGQGLCADKEKGKLPAETIKHEYELEYGTDIIEIHKDAIGKGDRILLVDDLLATGGTALAAAALIEKLGGTVAEMCFIVDLPDVGGRKKLRQRDTRSLR